MPPSRQVSAAQRNSTDRERRPRAADANSEIKTRIARPRIAPEIEEIILELALTQPSFGQDRVAREMQARRLFVSASGVRYVWQRHDLETLEKRIARVEKHNRETNASWTSAQLAARERVRAGRRSRRLAAETIGVEAEDVSRSHYLLAIAARLFHERGYDATSLRDIARAAQIPVGSLYYHFPSKEELFEAVYEEGVRRLTELVLEAIAKASTPFDRLLAACTVHLRQMCEHDDFTRAAIPTRLPKVDARIRSKIIAMNNRYERIFKDLITELDLPADVQPGVLRLLILGALNWASTWYRPGKSAPEEIAVNLINALRLPLGPVK